MGETTITRGFNVVETSELERAELAVRSGKSVLSSRSGNPVLTMGGIGKRETTRTVKPVARKPLMISSVERSEAMACRALGDWVRNASLRTTATMHSRGSRGTSNDKA